MTNSKWTPTGQGNLLLTGDNFVISYRDFSDEAESDGLVDLLAGLATALSGNSEHTKKQKETALCSPDGKFYILNGDFRKDYEGIASQGYDACLTFYKSQMEDHNSVWSNRLPETEV